MKYFLSSLLLISIGFNVLAINELSKDKKRINGFGDVNFALSKSLLLNDLRKKEINIYAPPGTKMHSKKVSDFTVNIRPLNIYVEDKKDLASPGYNHFMAHNYRQVFDYACYIYDQDKALSNYLTQVLSPVHIGSENLQNALKKNDNVTIESMIKNGSASHISGKSDTVF